MILLDFIEKVKPLGLFSRSDLELLYPGLDGRRLYEWHSRGFIMKLRNGWYCLPEFLEDPYSFWMIANAVHQPSYVSLESALSYHGLIPEGVYMTTSVCTKRTIDLSMAGHNFKFSSLKKELYFGYTLIGTEKFHRQIRVAEPEKALIDFFYLHPEYNSEEDYVQLRFNGAVIRDLILEEKLLNYLPPFRNRKLENRVNSMLKVYGYA